MINPEYQFGAGVGSCRVCSKSVFLTERLLINGNLYHHACFRCARCNTQLNTNTNINNNDNTNNSNNDNNNNVILCELCINNDVNNVNHNDASSSSPLYKPSSLVSSRRLLFENISYLTDDAKAAKKYKNQNIADSPTDMKSTNNDYKCKTDVIINNEKNRKEFHENDHRKFRYSNTTDTDSSPVMPNDNNNHPNLFLQNDNLMSNSDINTFTPSLNSDVNEYTNHSNAQLELNLSNTYVPSNEHSNGNLHSTSDPSSTINSSNAMNGDSKDHLNSTLDLLSRNTISVAMGNNDSEVDSTSSSLNTNIDAIKVDSNDQLETEIDSLSTNIITSGAMIDNLNDNSGQCFDDSNSNVKSITKGEDHLTASNLSATVDGNIPEDHCNSLVDDSKLEVINDSCISHLDSKIHDSCTDNNQNNDMNENENSSTNVVTVSDFNSIEHQHLKGNIDSSDRQEDSLKNTEVSLPNQEDHIKVNSECLSSEVQSEGYSENSVLWTPIADKMEDELSKKFEDNLEISDLDSRKTPKKSNVKIKADSSDYPKDLNPFSEDEDEDYCGDSSAVAREPTNPFDTDTEEERNTNPFLSESDDEEDVEIKRKPVPLPRTIKRTVTPVPSPRQSLAGKSNLSVSSTSLSSQKSTPRKKKPAPQPPGFKTTSAVSSGLEKSPGNVEKPEQKMYNRKKGPAPARPKPERRPIRTMPLEEITKQLSDIEIKQLELERQGIKLEQVIREKSDTEPVEPAVEEMVLQLFECVNEKNALFRKHSELVYLRRMQTLDEEHADTEYKIRCLMLTPESNRTDEDKRMEEQLITRLVEIVEKRNELIEKMEEERNREIAEDSSVSRQLDDDVLEGKVKIKKKKKKSKEEKEGSDKSPSKKIKEKFMTLKHTAKKLSPKT